jgi:NAD(P)-dependent dehydrogenase (short-subunit alcohol dehydrogenase family)
MMQIQDMVLFITGANRGLGLAFARAALELGARKVYAAARDPARILLPGVHAVRLDVTRAEDADAAAEGCRDVNVLINNAGISRGSSVLVTAGMDAARAELETNFYGPWRMSQAFAPVLAAHGGGAIVNVLSALSWLNLPGGSTYCISKSAAWGLTNALRNELRAQHTQVLGLHVGFMDTDLTAGLNAPKVSPDDVALQTLRALAAGVEEVLADAISRDVKRGLSAEPGIYLQPAA